MVPPWTPSFTDPTQDRRLGSRRANPGSARHRGRQGNGAAELLAQLAVAVAGFARHRSPTISDARRFFPLEMRSIFSG
jgi:hypothetical protein